MRGERPCISAVAFMLAPPRRNRCRGGGGYRPHGQRQIVSGVGNYGIIILAPTGSITGNTFLGSQIGIELAADGASVTSNKIYGAVTYGIDVGATALKKSIVEEQHNQDREISRLNRQ